ncbi:MAG: hypothetical protein K0Q94_5764, partial [Paenibacillus sp.]|nr:hypothetical protein [Paenibacillus sp.]
MTKRTKRVKPLRLTALALTGAILATQIAIAA